MNFETERFYVKIVSAVLVENENTDVIKFCDHSNYDYFAQVRFSQYFSLLENCFFVSNLVFRRNSWEYVSGGLYLSLTAFFALEGDRRQGSSLLGA